MADYDNDNGRYAGMRLMTQLLLISINDIPDEPRYDRDRSASPRDRDEPRSDRDRARSRSPNSRPDERYVPTSSL